MNQRFFFHLEEKLNVKAILNDVIEQSVAEGGLVLRDISSIFSCFEITIWLLVIIGIKQKS